MQFLLIKLDSPDATPAYALSSTKQVTGQFTSSDWNQIRSLTKGHRVVLLLPDNDVVLASQRIPSKNKKQLVKAVPYALEESLAEDIETLHFVIHKDSSDDLAHVAVISRNLLSRYLEKLEKERITLHFALPRLFLLESHPNSWTVFKEGSRIRVRKTLYDGFTCDESMIGLFLAEELEDAPPQAIYSNLTAAQLSIDTADDAKEIEFHPASESAGLSYDSLQKALPLNLTQGFIRDRKASAINLTPWKPAFALAALLAASWTIILFWQNHQLDSQRDQLNTAIHQVFKRTFPASRIVDPPQQMASKLKEFESSAVKPGESPLPVIADVSPLLKKFADMNLNEIRFDNNELQLVVQTGNLTRLEAFKNEAAKSANLLVNIKSSTTTADKVEATLVVRPQQATGGA